MRSGIASGSGQSAANAYPCGLCDNHYGQNAFVRRDNLRQHLKVYHRYNKESVDRYCESLPAFHIGNSNTQTVVQQSGP